MNSQATATEPHSAAPDWAALAGEWQALAQQWAQWWTRGDHLGAPALDSGNAALAVLAPADARIDPSAVAELTERYNARFNQLWEHAVARAAGAPGTKTDAPME